MEHSREIILDMRASRRDDGVCTITSDTLKWLYVVGDDIEGCINVARVEITDYLKHVGYTISRMSVVDPWQVRGRFDVPPYMIAEVANSRAA